MPTDTTEPFDRKRPIMQSALWPYRLVRQGRGRGSRVVSGHGQDSHLRGRLGCSPQRGIRRGHIVLVAGAAWILEVLLRVPHSVQRGEGTRRIRALPVHGAEPGVPRGTDDLARDGTGVMRRESTSSTCARCAGRSRRSASSPDGSSGFRRQLARYKEEMGCEPDRPRQPRRPLCPRHRSRVRGTRSSSSSRS